MLGRVERLKLTGDNLIKSALVLHELEKKMGEHGYNDAFHLLASQALELLPKSVIAAHICLDENHNSEEQICCRIQRELSCLSHKLDNIFNEVSDLKRKLNILNISRFNKTKFVDEYRFKLNGLQHEISIKSIEAVRYGWFAREKDIARDDSGNNHIAGLLKNLSNEVDNVFQEINNKIDKTT